MNDYRPYVEEKRYRYELTKDEIILIEKIRDIKYGSVKAYITSGRVARTETTKSELMKELTDTGDALAVETVIEFERKV